MKKYLIFFSLVLVFLAPKSIVQASNSFIINSFKSELTIQADGRLHVKETILVNFTAPLHGIYRDLPTTYRNSDGSSHYTSIEVLPVSDGAKTVTSEIISNDNNLRIKIGDPNILVSGPKTYIIEYNVSGVISSYADYDELYWNVTGNDWEVPIVSSSASLSIPSGNILKTACYQGAYNSTEACDTTYKNQQASFIVQRQLEPSEGMTVAVGFTKGIVPILAIAAPITLPSLITGTSVVYMFFSFLAVIFLVFIVLLRLWWLKGRDSYYKRKSLNDPDQKETILPLFGSYEPIVPEYETPAKLRPGEIGVLMDEKANTIDVSATIVDLAVRGYLTITEIPKTGVVEKLNNLMQGHLPGGMDYLLKKINKDTTELLPYEKTVIEEIFDSRSAIKTSDLTDNFTSSLEKIKDSLYGLVKTKKLFYDNPDKIRTKYRMIATVIMVAGLAYLLFVATLWYPTTPTYVNLYCISLGVVAGLVLSGLILMFFAHLMPKRTAYGRDLYRQALGYKLFVSGTEKYRQPFFEKENIFMEVLPYAMVFGVTSKLASAMKEMGLAQTASWYIGTTAFNANTFVSNINNFSNTLSASMVSTPSSSGSGGGGFSGGGFGGGGGGGW